MKRKGEYPSFLIVISICFLLSLSLISAADNETQIQTNSGKSLSASLDKGYACLADKVKSNCASLTFEEQIFSLLALAGNSDVRSECQSALIQNSDNSQCWPKGNCNIKSTAQAILALQRIGEDTEAAEAWLIGKNQTSTELTWYLEIESNKASDCSVTYAGQSYAIKIAEDKKINTEAGTCLSLSDGNYWLKVNPSCYTQTFTISCNEGFLTTLLYQRKDSATIYVSSQVSSQAAQGTTEEKINALCFGLNGKCDYEGTAWSTIVLDKNNDITPFIPYLTALTNDYPKILPESFLYMLTEYTDFYVQLVSKQQPSGYWDASGDKLYDTSLAYWALHNDDSLEKSNAQNYLLQVQSDNGCWNNNVRNTAFILYSLIPRGITTSVPEAIDYCEDSGLSGSECMPPIACDEAGGDILENYDCSFGNEICCSKSRQIESCLDQGGEICTGDEICTGSDIPSSDDSANKFCCIGSCQTPSVQESECEQIGGTCQSSCGTDEVEDLASCNSGADVCCVFQSAPEKSSLSWLWLILIILIILVALAIIYRDKLRLLK